MVDSYSERYSKYLNAINSKLNELLVNSEYDDEIVCNAMKYSISNGGKRIRPVLVCECCRICGGDYETALAVACAIEMIHTYSLIHDDLPCMDDDDIRRGKPSCHIEFGEEYALLAGDALLTLAFEVIANSSLDSDKKVKCIACLSKSAGINGMVGGQVVDLRSEGKKIPYERLRTMHSLKTGALIKCSAELGCICADADTNSTEKLVNYASYIGLAFQIVDDILDVTGTQEELGKPIGSDEECEKTTFVTLFGLEKSQRMASELTNNAICEISSFNDKDFLTTLAKNLSVRKK